MSLDMEQFHEVYFVESLELLDQMEAEVLRLAPGATDVERVNTIFRVAHSIKGGAGMFGFKLIGAFTHSLETLLDELRTGRMPVKSSMCDVLLQSVDVIRGMLIAQQKKQPVDEAGARRLQELVGALAAGQEPAVVPVVVPATAAVAPAPAKPVSTTWLISFTALPGLLARGIDPVRLFEDLAGLGDLEVLADLSNLPPLEDVDPAHCRIRWNLTLVSSMPKASIELIFDWAEGDCELVIERVGVPVVAPAPALPVQPFQPEVVGDASVAGSATTPASASPPPQAAASPTAAPANTSPAAASPAAVATKTQTGAPSASTPALVAASAPSGAPASEVNSIRVGIDKIDDLLNTVGEVVITQTMLAQLAAELAGPQADRLRHGLAQLEANVRELQESVMRVRMLPVGSVFSRFPRLVRDLSARLGKQVRLQLSGEQTELDKTVLEKIGDPLVHLVRNSVDHGIESPAERLAAGKPAEGTIRLNAFHKGGTIRLEITDDGRGLHRERLIERARSRKLIAADALLTDEQANELIFMPGFSTADQTTDVSGRGVGMDVVRRNIKELGGHVTVSSEPGRGTTIAITLPLTLAIVDGQTVSVGDETYIVPLVAIVESLQLRDRPVTPVHGHGELFHFRGEFLPVIRLHDIFGIEPRSRTLADGLLMVVEGDGQRAGLFIDALLGQQQVVIKSLETHYARIPGVGGATILGEGMVALILDVPGLLRLAAPARVAGPPALLRTGT